MECFDPLEKVSDVLKHGQKKEYSCIKTKSKKEFMKLESVIFLFSPYFGIFLWVGLNEMFKWSLLTWEI